jgi:ankyrin repeat protein
MPDGLELRERVNYRTYFRGIVSPLQYVCYLKHDLVQLFLKQKADPNLWNHELMSPLQIASFYCKIDIVKFLLEAGAEINARNKLGISALSAALGTKE